MSRNGTSLLVATLVCGLAAASTARAGDATHTLTFDEFAHGDVVDETYVDGIGPIYLDGRNPNAPCSSAAVAFDSADPTPTALDLGTPSSIYGGPGEGDGGASNDTPLGRMLIVSAEQVSCESAGHVDDPTPLDVDGAWLQVDFSNLPAPCYGVARVHSMRIVDIDECESGTVTLYDRLGGTLVTQQVPVTGDNGVAVIEFGTDGIDGVEQIIVVLNGTGAIDDVEFSCPCPDDEPPPPAEPFVCEGGIKKLELRYLGSPDGVTITVTGKKGDDPIATFSDVDQGDTLFFESNDAKKGKFPSEIVVHVLDGQTELEASAIHVSCSQPIDIGFVYGSFEVVALTARGSNDKGKGKDDDDKSGKGKDDDGKSGGENAGAPCEGGLSAITLRYEGDDDDVTVRITGKNGDVLATFAHVDAGDEVAAQSTDEKKGKFPSEITVEVLFEDGTLLGSTAIHVSCSQPIAPGFVYGDFVVVEFTSRGAGRITADDGDWSQTRDDDDGSSGSAGGPSGAPCEGGLTEITVEYIGAVWNARVELTDKKGEHVLANFDVVNHGDALHATYDPQVKKDKFPSEIVFNVYDGTDLVESTPIHVSCSQPIAPGFVYGNFVVTAFTSKEGGAVEGQDDFPTIRVNAGGPTYVDLQGNVWAADTAFSGGTPFQRPGLAIDGTLDDPLYESERYGNFAYDFGVPDGLYSVTLHMAEIYWQTPGSRAFHVSAEGERRVEALDLIVTAGYTTAHDIHLLVEVRDGSLNLQFVTITDNAKVGAITVDRIGDVAPAKGATKGKNAAKRKTKKHRARHRRRGSRRAAR